MKRIVSALFCASCLLTAHAQSRLSVGGYGEAVFSRNFYSDHVSRYSQPEEHKDDPSHGRFDIPHACHAAAPPTHRPIPSGPLPSKILNRLKKDEIYAFLSSR